MRRVVFETMGTVASIALDDPVAEKVLAAVRRVFERYDRTFSLYLPDSPLSRIAAGTLRLEDAGAEVRDEYARACEWAVRTNGWFTPHRPDGVIDLSGTVKATAIAEAAALLESAGADGTLGVGGDVVRLGPSAQRIGVVDPADRGRLLADPELDQRRAIATSGRAERGDHIWSRLGPTDIDQVTVLADDIHTADVLATAIVAAGTERLRDLLDSFDVDALVVAGDELLATPGWPRTEAAA